jgi:hypothetical protein
VDCEDKTDEINCYYIQMSSDYAIESTPKVIIQGAPKVLRQLWEVISRELLGLGKWPYERTSDIETNGTCEIVLVPRVAKIKPLKVVSELLEHPV